MEAQFNNKKTLEADSDSDFTPGIYIPEPSTTKRGRKSGGNKKAGRARVDDHESSSEGRPETKKRRLDLPSSGRTQGKGKTKSRSKFSRARCFPLTFFVSIAGTKSVAAQGGNPLLKYFGS